MMLAILLGVVLVALNAYFVAAEFALVSAERSRIESEKPTKRSLRTVEAIEHVSEMMAVAQLGITTCSVLLGAVAEPALEHLVAVPFEALSVPEGVVVPASFALALLVVVSVHMVLGEMVPKNIAIAGPERAALLLGPSLYRLGRLVRPVVRGLNGVANSVLRLVKVEPVDEVVHSYDRQEVQDLAESSRREGNLGEDEYGMLASALSFEGETVEKVLMPEAELHTLSYGSTPEDVEKACRESGYSRYPVRSGAELLGYVHVKDILSMPPGEAIPRRRIRRMPSLDARTTLQEALEEMRSTKTHLAQVRREGKRIGVVALEDVLEELVGEVQDAAQE